MIRLHCVKKLVNIGLVTVEFKKGVCGIFAVTRLHLTTVLHLATGVLKRIGISQFRLQLVNQQ